MPTEAANNTRGLSYHGSVSKLYKIMNTQQINIDNVYSVASA